MNESFNRNEWMQFLYNRFVYIQGDLYKNSSPDKIRGDFNIWLGNLSDEQKAELEKEFINKQSERERMESIHRQNLMESNREMAEAKELAEAERDRKEAILIQNRLDANREKAEAKAMDEATKANNEWNRSVTMSETRKQIDLQEMKKDTVKKIREFASNKIDTKKNVEEVVNNLAKYYKNGEETIFKNLDDNSIELKDDIKENLRYLPGKELRIFVKKQLDYLEKYYEERIKDDKMNNFGINENYYTEFKKIKMQELSSNVCALLYIDIENKRHNSDLTSISLNPIGSVSSSSVSNFQVDILDSITMSNELYPYNYVHPKIQEEATNHVSLYKENIIKENKIVALQNVKAAYKNMSAFGKLKNLISMRRIEKLSAVDQLSVDELNAYATKLDTASSKGGVKR